MNSASSENNINPQEVWLVKFPYEENDGRFKTRPVVVLQEVTETELLSVVELELKETHYISVKVTKHETRDYDNYDTKLVKWREAQLDYESVARVSKTINIPKSQFIKKIGITDDEDYINILEKYLELLEKINN